MIGVVVAAKWNILIVFHEEFVFQRVSISVSQGTSCVLHLF